MRDPLTKLAIVDPREVDKDICKAFPEYFAVSGRLAVLHYVGRVTRRTRFGTETRVVLVSSNCLYMCRENGAKRRCVRIERITKVNQFQDMYVLLSVPAEYDLLFKLHNTAETDYFINVLRVVKSFIAPDQPPLPLTAVPGDSKRLNSIFPKPDNYVNEVKEVPFIQEPDSKAQALDAFLSPPPPPEAKGSLKLAVGSPSNKAMLILRHPLLDSSLSVTRDAPPQASTGSGQTPNKPELGETRVEYNEQLTRLHEAQEELARQQAAQVELSKKMSASPQPADVISVSSAEKPPVMMVTPSPGGVGASPGSMLHQTSAVGGVSPLPDRSPISVAKMWQSPAEMRETTNRSLSQHQATAPPVDAAASGPSTDNELTLQRRVLSLEDELTHLREQLELQQARAQEVGYRMGVAASAPTQQPTQPQQSTAMFSTPQHTAATYASPPPRPVAPTTAIAASPQPMMEPLAGSAGRGHSGAPVPRQTVGEFEKTIQSRTLEERVVLRQFQIDDKKAKIAALLKSTSEYDSGEVFQLQEDLMELITLMEKDLTKAAKDPKTANVVGKHAARTTGNANAGASARARAELAQAHVNFQQMQPPEAVGMPGSGAIAAGAESSPQQSQEMFLNWMGAVTKALVENEERQRRHAAKKETVVVVGGSSTIANADGSSGKVATPTNPAAAASRPKWRK